MSLPSTILSCKTSKISSLTSHKPGESDCRVYEPKEMPTYSSYKPIGVAIAILATYFGSTSIWMYMPMPARSIMLNMLNIRNTQLNSDSNQLSPFLELHKQECKH